MPRSYDGPHVWGRRCMRRSRWRWRRAVCLHSTVRDWRYCSPRAREREYAEFKSRFWERRGISNLLNHIQWAHPHSLPNILPSSNTSSKLNQTKIKTLHAFNPLSEFYQSTNSLVRYQPNRTSCQGKLQVQIRLPHIRYAEHHAQGSRTKWFSSQESSPVKTCISADTYSIL